LTPAFRDYTLYLSHSEHVFVYRTVYFESEALVTKPKTPSQAE
jgi:hypothetical protein